MYREEDEVYVFNDGHLYEDKMRIVTMKNDEEFFTVEGKDNAENVVTLNIPRSHIMDEDEVDKIAKLLVENNAMKLGSASANDEVNDYLNGKEDESVTVFYDATLDGIVETIAGSFSTIQEFEGWFKETFSHYSPNGIYKLNNKYYIVIIN